MRYRLIILIAALAFSCSSNKVPKGILTDKEITPVIIELHLAEAIYTQRHSAETNRENFQEDLYLSILKKHKLDQKVFEASVFYYGQHPDKYKPIYDEVLNQLNEMIVKARAKDSIDARKPVAKDIAKDSAAMKKAAAAKDSLKALDVKAKADSALKAKKTDADIKAKDAKKIKMSGTKGAVRDSLKTKLSVKKIRKIDSTPTGKPAIKAGVKDTIPIKK
ncbi:MAG TPA: DUF4296 domain-containing protein [Prolixibacteraceae bacterium]|jgi:LAS superfamily LD-carboxypeptidase LdcB